MVDLNPLHYNLDGSKNRPESKAITKEQAAKKKPGWNQPKKKHLHK